MDAGRVTWFRQLQGGVVLRADWEVEDLPKKMVEDGTESATLGHSYWSVGLGVKKQVGICAAVPAFLRYRQSEMCIYFMQFVKELSFFYFPLSSVLRLRQTGL